MPSFLGRAGANKIFLIALAVIVAVVAWEAYREYA